MACGWTQNSSCVGECVHCWDYDCSLLFNLSVFVVGKNVTMRIGEEGSEAVSIEFCQILVSIEARFKANTEKLILIFP